MLFAMLIFIQAFIMDPWGKSSVIFGCQHSFGVMV